MSEASPIDPAAIDWIAVDWGTTNFRAWAMASNQPVETVTAPVGMASLRRDEFEGALLSRIGGWLAPERRTPVIACGMVGARQGWQEAPYAAVPSSPVVASRLSHIESSDSRVAVTIVHGLSQLSPPDVMRGEETQIAGLLALEPAFEGAACLPGTHSKWVRLREGRVEAFQTFMTGELYSLLAGQSVLRHSIGTEEDVPEQAFEEAVETAARDPEHLPALLFSIRAAGLVGKPDAAVARGRLSGLLIGSEIAAARHIRGDLPVMLVGATGLGLRYRRAFERLGIDARSIETEACTLAGLSAAKTLLETERAP